MPTKPTQNTPIKFTAEDKALIAEIRARLRCNSIADTIRQALRITNMVIQARTIHIQVDPDDDSPKKSRKRA